MSGFHGRMMNLQIEKPAGKSLAYKYGHRDARHAAAEIALEADRMAAHIRRGEAALDAYFGGPQDAGEPRSDVFAAEALANGVETLLRERETTENAVAEKIAQAEALFATFAAESDARAQAAFAAWEKQVAQLNAKIRALLGQATAAKEMAEALRSIAHHVDPNSADGTYRYDSASDACDFAFSRASEALAAWTAAKEGR